MAFGKSCDILSDGKYRPAWNKRVIEAHALDELCGNALNPDRFPSVSFVIPMLNSERTLDTCLKSIARQDYPRVEIIIVDNGSTDSSLDIARKYTDKIFFDGGKLGSVRQTGIEQANGEIIGIFDTDIELPHENWLRNAVKYFHYDDRIGNVWPRNKEPVSHTLTASLYWNLWLLIIKDRIKNDRGVFGGGISLFTKKCLVDVGGIDRDVHWGEDYSLARKLSERGYMVVFTDDPVYHDTDMCISFSKFVKKQLITARALSRSNFKPMNLSLKAVLHEQVGLGARGFVRGLVYDRDISWVLFPLFVLSRIFIYGYIYLTSAGYARRQE